MKRLAAAAARQRRKKTRRDVTKPEKRPRFLWRDVVDGLVNVRVSMTERRIDPAHRTATAQAKKKEDGEEAELSGGQTPSSSEPTLPSQGHRSLGGPLHRACVHPCAS